VLLIAVILACSTGAGVWVRSTQNRKMTAVSPANEGPPMLLPYTVAGDLANEEKGGSVMANPQKRVPENVPGDFFVDATCIDCDACRQIAPSTFGEPAESSFVKVQAKSSAERRQALQALLACPTGSIGCFGDDDLQVVMKDFPLSVEEPVFYCGYNSPKSYGGNSYFIKHAAGNWLIDSSKFVTPLVHQLKELGGIAYIFLTHRDDVADAERYAEHF
jgi:ferredoxin